MKTNQSIHKIILLLFLVCCNTGFAQLLKQKDRYTVYVNYPDYSVKATVSNSTGRFPVNESLTYYWYSANKILQTKGDYDGKVVDGPYISFYLSNSLKEKGEFKRGLKHGKWISWYENGRINEITNWKNGMKYGVYKKFNADDSPEVMYRYKQDKLHGQQVFYKEGKPDSVRKFKYGVEVKAGTDQTVFKKIKEAFKVKKEKPKQETERSEPINEKPKRKESKKEELKKEELKKEELKKEEVITLKKKKKTKATAEKSVSSVENAGKE